MGSVSHHSQSSGAGVPAAMDVSEGKRCQPGVERRTGTPALQLSVARASRARDFRCPSLVGRDARRTCFGRLR